MENSKINLGQFGLVVALLLLIIFQFIEKHFITIICIIGAVILAYLLLKDSNDFDDLPPDKFNG